MSSKIQKAKNLQSQIYRVADQILAKLGPQTKGDVHIAIAALAVAMCSLARAERMPFDHMQEAVTIAFAQVNAEELPLPTN
jgi:hypothetical protein